MGTNKTIPEYVDFKAEIKNLHEKMCKEIAAVMKATGTKKMELLGDATITMENKYLDEINEMKVLTVLLHDDGEVYVIINDLFEENEINILRNQYIIPCGVVNLYEVVFKKCVIKKHKK